MQTNLVRLFATTLLLAFTATAQAVIIQDTYIGSNDHGYGDRIGNSSYEVQNMDVTFSGDYMNVRVNTNFNQATDKLVQFGDLFISIDGWHPYGTAPYKQDNAITGEHWEFVFDTSAKSLFGGNFTINLSDNMIPSGYIFRNGQEVQRKAGGTAFGGSSVDTSHAGVGGYVQYSILLSSLGVISGDIGLKWGMSCANDTIEGKVTAPHQVPEAGSLSLLAIALLGLGVARFKKA